MQLGATGGYMGHILLATSVPRAVHRGTPEAHHLRALWPQDHDVQTMWRVRTMESTRSQEGIHESIYLMYVDKAGFIITVGQEGRDQYFRFEQSVKVEIWQCPPSLRQGFRIDIMGKVLDQMMQHEGNWSWTTAVRAFFFSAHVPHSARRASQMEDIQQAWTSDPICSSLVVVFWQRYLCELAAFFNATASPRSPRPHAKEVHAMDLIMQYMPLKSDRALPGDLAHTLPQCDWVLVTCLPRHGPSRQTSTKSTASAPNMGKRPRCSSFVVPC